MAASLEANAIDAAIDSQFAAAVRRADDLFDLLRKRGIGAQIYGLASETLRLVEPLGDHVPDDHAGGPQQLASVRAR